jgi:hypothetical protein
MMETPWWNGEGSRKGPSFPVVLSCTTLLPERKGNILFYNRWLEKNLENLLAISID